MARILGEECSGARLKRLCEEEMDIMLATLFGGAAVLAVAFESTWGALVLGGIAFWPIKYGV